MTWSLIASVAKQNSASDTGASSAIDTTGADLIVVIATLSSNTGTTFSDNKSNSWTQVVWDGGSLCQYYCQAPTVGSGHTFRLQNAGSIFPAIAVFAFSGSTATPVGSSSFLAAVQGGSQPGSITPASGSLVVTGFGCQTNSVGTLTDSNLTYNTVVGTAWAHGATDGASGSWAVDAGGLSTNPAWTSAGSVATAVNIVEYKASGGGGGGNLFTSSNMDGLGSGGHFFSDRLAA